MFSVLKVDFMPYLYLSRRNWISNWWKAFIFTHKGQSRVTALLGRSRGLTGTTYVGIFPGGIDMYSRSFGLGTWEYFSPCLYKSAPDSLYQL